uniref:Aminoglycoside phosphotransferase domain-containing protein n=1 Tax=Bionectria ochroleuca TaxID=29856 RepID=A0A8H7NQ32_BIOOC
MIIETRYKGPPARIKGNPTEMPGTSICDSVVQVAPNAWKLGDLIICERVGTGPVNGAAVTSWRDEEGILWYLRRGRKSDTRYFGAGRYAPPYHRSGTSGAIWKLGGMYVKVKAWSDGLDPESDTLKIIHETCPGVPVPQVIAHWVDKTMSRSFIILRPLAGQMLLHAWPSLSPELRQHVANQIADACEIMAKHSATYMGSAADPLNGCRDHYLCPERPVSIPSWKPISLPRIDEWNGQEYFDPFQIGRVFYLYHPELEPTNIFVTPDGRVTGILDWERAGYFPRCWISTKPQIADEFLLDAGPGVPDVTEWQRRLSTTLEERGFIPEREEWEEFRGRISGTVSTAVSFVKYFPAENDEAEDGDVPMDEAGESSGTNGHHDPHDAWH